MNKRIIAIVVCAGMALTASARQVSPSWHPAPGIPGWTPTGLPVGVPAAPAFAPVIPATHSWSDQCLVYSNCRRLGVLPCVLGGGCAVNGPLTAVWCDGPALVVEECAGGWVLGVDCMETPSGTPDCGVQWSAPCLCNGTLGTPMGATTRCQRPTCYTF